MESMVAVEAVAEAELAAVMARLDIIFQRVREAWKDAAGLLARLSGPQLDEVKRRFRGVVTADHLERLAMMGGGKLAPHLALPEKTISAQLLKRLPESTLGALNDPAREVEVWRPDGRVFTRRMRELSQMELQQIVSEAGEIRTADQQRRSLLAIARAAKPAADNADELVFDGLKLADEGQAALLFWRFASDAPETRRYSGKLPMKTLRGLLR